MRKKFVLLALLVMIAFIGCQGNKTTSVNDDSSLVEGEDCCASEAENEWPDLDEEVDVPDYEIHGDPLNDTFFDDMPVEWEAFFTLKMFGLINDPANTDPDMAFLVKNNATLLGESYNLGDNYGLYTRDTLAMSDGTTAPAIVGVGVGNFSWPISNTLASVWVGQTAVWVDDLKNWEKEANALCTDHIAVDWSTMVTVFEVWIGIVGAAQTTRMECVRGLSEMNSEKSAYEGAMYLCVESNTEWAVGEQMKMMQYSKMIDDPVELLAVLNEGLTSEDPEYRTDVCRCYESDGVTPMDCEAMKDEFGIGELPDDDALLTDETPDDDVLISD